MNAPAAEVPRARFALARSALLALAIYSLLMLAWPWTGPVFARTAALLGSLTLADYSSGASAWFTPDASEGPLRLKISFQHRSWTWRGEMFMRLRGQAYLSWALLTALCLASPVPWKRRALALVLGWILLAAFFVLGLWATLMDWTVSRVDADPYGSSRLASGFYSYLCRYSAESPMSSVLVPVLIWLIAVFRQEDWAKLTAGSDEARASGA